MHGTVATPATGAMIAATTVSAPAAAAALPHPTQVDEPQTRSVELVSDPG